MSHSFYEVLPYILKKDSREITLNYDFLDTYVKDEDKIAELEESFYRLTNDYHGHTVVFELPAFTGEHFEHSNNTKEFEAKTFSIEIISTDETLDDAYEGKTWYSYSINVVDKDSGEKMYAWASYFASIDHYLTDFGIELDESEKKVAEHNAQMENYQPSVFVIVENMHYEGFIVHGMFDQLNKAVTQIQQVKEQNISNCKDFVIEEVKMNCFNEYNPDVDYTRSLIRGSVAKYQSDGTLIERF